MLKVDTSKIANLINMCAVEADIREDILDLGEHMNYIIMQYQKALIEDDAIKARYALDVVRDLEKAVEKLSKRLWTINIQVSAMYRTLTDVEREQAKNVWAALLQEQEERNLERLHQFASTVIERLVTYN